ncbi:MAG: DUF1080 domain-containing protein [Draconibacterium sp.]|nr:DUF1080 domain-containing protein [Draconibacterium sp.]
MKTLLFTFIGIIFSFSILAQIVVPDVRNKSELKIHNRHAVVTMQEMGVIHSVELDAKEGDGIAIFENIEFENGTIEFEVKGKNVPGKSFVGIAFHVQDNETYNAIYFRPFNFQNTDKARSGHSVQYISHPEFTWKKLRNNFPEQFENPVKPIPDPNEWFHAKVVVNWPTVKVYVENSKIPSLNIKSEFNNGKIGFWVGNGSDGEFKNLVVIKK